MPKTSPERAPTALKIPISRFLYDTDAEMYVINSMTANTNTPMPTYNKICAIVLMSEPHIFNSNDVIYQRVLYSVLAFQREFDDFFNIGFGKLFSRYSHCVFACRVDFYCCGNCIRHAYKTSILVPAFKEKSFYKYVFSR